MVKRKSSQKKIKNISREVNKVIAKEYAELEYKYITLKKEYEMLKRLCSIYNVAQGEIRKQKIGKLSPRARKKYKELMKNIVKSRREPNQLKTTTRKKKPSAVNRKRQSSVNKKPSGENRTQKAMTVSREPNVNNKAFGENRTQNAMTVSREPSINNKASGENRTQNAMTVSREPSVNKKLSGENLSELSSSSPNTHYHKDYLNPSNTSNGSESFMNN